LVKKFYYPFSTQPRAFTHPNGVEPSLPFLGSLHLLDRLESS